MTLDRRTVLAGLGVLAAPLGPTLGSLPARAAEWAPSRPVRMIVPYPAGGPTDAIARYVAQEMGSALGQPVVTENLAGASGAVGTRAVAKSDPDGHTIVLGNNQTHGNNMFLLKDPGYDAVKDFAPLAGAGAFEHVFVVRTDLPAKSIPELVALAKAEPGKLNYGSTGVGSGSHLATELFMNRTGIKMTHVPFRGAAPLVQELVAQRIDVSVSTLPSVLPQIQGGTLRALAVASPQRNPNLPDVPTLREGGVTDADADSWTAFFAPARTPAPILDRLSRECVAALNKPSVRDAIAKLGFTSKVRAPEEFRPYLQHEIATWGEIIRVAGVKQEG